MCIKTTTLYIRNKIMLSFSRSTPYKKYYLLFCSRGISIERERGYNKNSSKIMLNKLIDLKHKRKKYSYLYIRGQKLIL